jgi:hypothetical protein
MEGLIKIKYSKQEVQIENLDDFFWEKTDEVKIKNYWSGLEAEKSRHSTVNLLWGEDFLWVRFVCNQGETLYINDKPSLTKKSIGLWDFDVCEIFLAPNLENTAKYYEFEVSPSGEWLDLAIHQMPEKRETDWEFKSNMKVATKILENSIIMAIQIPWKAFGKKPYEGEKWGGNLFRCVGKGENRGYLAWQPTLTEKPNFHIPKKFGWFEFVK